MHLDVTTGEVVLFMAFAVVAGLLGAIGFFEWGVSLIGKALFGPKRKP